MTKKKNTLKTMYTCCKNNLHKMTTLGQTWFQAKASLLLTQSIPIESYYTIRFFFCCIVGMPTLCNVLLYS